MWGLGIAGLRTLPGDSRDLRSRCDRRPRRLQSQPPPPNLNVCVRVDGQGQIQVLHEDGPEVVEARHPSPELGVERLPGHIPVAWQGMEPVSEPAVDVQCHRVAVDCPDGRVIDGDRVPFQLFEEGL
jgi:hypothetical protein